MVQDTSEGLLKTVRRVRGVGDGIEVLIMYFLHVVHKSVAPMSGLAWPAEDAELAPLTLPKMWRTTTLPM